MRISIKVIEINEKRPFSQRHQRFGKNAKKKIVVKFIKRKHERLRNGDVQNKRPNNG